MGSIGPHIDATVWYLDNLGQGYTAGTLAVRNYKFIHLPTQIYDARHIQASLDVQGFQLITQPSALPASEHTNPDRIKTVIYPETEDIIRRATGAARVHAYSHLVRTHSWQDVQPQLDDKSISDDHPLSGVPPSRGAHIDHSAHGSFEILRDNTSSEEAERVVQSGKRWGIINLWRPIKPIERDPLCVCDARSVEEADIRVQTVRLPNDNKFGGVSKGKSFESVSCTPNPKHEWYYCSDMQPEEAWLIKIHDSAAAAAGKGGSGIAGGIPHTSFQLPATQHLPARSSYEMRCLIFWD